MHRMRAADTQERDTQRVRITAHKAGNVLHRRHTRTEKNTPTGEMPETDKTMKARTARKIYYTPLDRIRNYTNKQLIRAYGIVSRIDKRDVSELLSVALVLQEGRR